jgi:hypothetical protein
MMSLAAAAVVILPDLPKYCLLRQNHLFKNEVCLIKTKSGRAPKAIFAFRCWLF